MYGPVNSLFVLVRCLSTVLRLLGLFSRGLVVIGSGSRGRVGCGRSRGRRLGGWGRGHQSGCRDEWGWHSTGWAPLGGGKCIAARSAFSAMRWYGGLGAGALGITWLLS